MGERVYSDLLWLQVPISFLNLLTKAEYTPYPFEGMWDMVHLKIRKQVHLSGGSTCLDSYVKDALPAGAGGGNQSGFTTMAPIIIRSPIQALHLHHICQSSGMPSAQASGFCRRD